MADKITWLSYEGAPPLLIPDSLKHRWRGFYRRGGTEELGEPDLDLADGAWYIDAEFDFDNPRTDYDRACAAGMDENHAADKTHYFVPIGPGKGLVFQNEIDSITWWPEQNMAVSGVNLLDPAKLDGLAWEEELIWDLGEDELTLMNSCNHGLEPDMDDFIPVRLPAGRYSIECAQCPDDHGLLTLHRFTRTGPASE